MSFYMSPKGTPPLERIAARVHAEGDCLVWEGSAGKYGLINVDGKTRVVHRVLWETVVGPVPPGMDLDHLCRNRLCVNPDHLECVDHRTNVLRGTGPTAENAAKTECKRGHPFDESNTYIWRGGRICRTCRREAMRARRVP